MKEIYKKSSTNGRWGLILVADVIDDVEIEFPVRGNLIPIGEIGGFSTYRVDIDENAENYIDVFSDATVIEGGVVVETIDLQSSNIITLIAFSPKAIIKTVGYKGRSSQVSLYIDGQRQEVPASVMLALGLVESEGQIIEIPPIPPASSALEDALRKAGIS